MNQVNFSEEDPLCDFDVDALPLADLKSKFLDEKQRCLVLERDLFKSQAECRRLTA